MAVKRLLDISTALIGLIVLSPVMLVVAVVIRITMGTPTLFRQERIGRGEATFRVIKFRTMRLPKSEDGSGGDDAFRLTAVGRFLRRFSVDELPTLWNVLVGQMSLVGPRPLPAAYLPRYSERQRERHRVKPGITGWAQVNGRNSLDWETKLALDVWYVEKLSLTLDLLILGMTLRHLAWPTGINHDGHATMPEFLGVLEPQGAKRESQPEASVLGPHCYRRPAAR